MSVYTRNQSNKPTFMDKENFEILKQSTISIYREIKLLSNFSHWNKQALLKIFKHYRSKMFFMNNTEMNYKVLMKFQE